MKSTMSNRNIARYHKLLKLRVDVEEISDILKIDVDALKRFTPEIMAAVKIAKKRAANKAYGKETADEPQAELDLGDGSVKSETVEVEVKPKAKKKSAASAVADKE